MTIQTKSIKEVEEKVIELIHREPFFPFVFEMADGGSVPIPHPRLSVNETGAGFIGPRGGLVDVEFKDVRAIRLLNFRDFMTIQTKTIKEVEEKIIELIHREPFVPFAIEMADGGLIEVRHPRLAVNETGAGFFGPDGVLVDIEFRNVRGIRLFNAEPAA